MVSRTSANLRTTKGSISVSASWCAGFINYGLSNRGDCTEAGVGGGMKDLKVFGIAGEKIAALFALRYANDGQNTPKLVIEVQRTIHQFTVGLR